MCRCDPKSMFAGRPLTVSSSFILPPATLNALALPAMFIAGLVAPPVSG